MISTLQQTTYLHNDDTLVNAVSKHIEFLRNQATQFETWLESRGSELEGVTVKEARATGLLQDPSGGSKLL